MIACDSLHEPGLRPAPAFRSWLAQSRARSALPMLGVLGSCSATPTSFM